MTMTAALYSGLFKAEPANVRQVRHEVAECLGEWPRRDDVVLIVSELVTNAVQHSLSGFLGLPVAVRVERRDSWVRVEVEDAGGPWADHEPDDRPHGLAIVAALADGWGTSAVLAGRMVWARVSL